MMIETHTTEDTMTETDTQIRLRRAKEALILARDNENRLRKELAEATQRTAKAKERAAELFLQEEREECARRMASYRHCIA